MVDLGGQIKRALGYYNLRRFGLGFDTKKGALSQRGLQDKKHFSEQAWHGSCSLVITDYR